MDRRGPKKTSPISTHGPKSISQALAGLVLIQRQDYLPAKDTSRWRVVLIQPPRHPLREHLTNAKLNSTSTCPSPALTKIRASPNRIPNRSGNTSTNSEKPSTSNSKTVTSGSRWAENQPSFPSTIRTATNGTLARWAPTNSGSQSNWFSGFDNGTPKTGCCTLARANGIPVNRCPGGLTPACGGPTANPCGNEPICWPNQTASDLTAPTSPPSSCCGSHSRWKWNRKMSSPRTKMCLPSLTRNKAFPSTKIPPASTPTAAKTAAVWHASLTAESPKQPASSCRSNARGGRPTRNGHRDRGRSAAANWFSFQATHQSG